MIPAQQRKPLECLEEALNDVGALLWAHENLGYYTTDEGLTAEGQHALSLMLSIIIEKQKEAELAAAALRKALVGEGGAA
ncbi:hypothetical protein LCM08_00555 [Salipiger pacificus]|nr:hypothetical protein [Alloyangia pacifica]